MFKTNKKTKLAVLASAVVLVLPGCGFIYPNSLRENSGSKISTAPVPNLCETLSATVDAKKLGVKKLLPPRNDYLKDADRSCILEEDTLENKNEDQYVSSFLLLNRARAGALYDTDKWFTEVTNSSSNCSDYSSFVYEDKYVGAQIFCAGDEDLLSVYAASVVREKDDVYRFAIIRSKSSKGSPWSEREGFKVLTRVLSDLFNQSAAIMNRRVDAAGGENDNLQPVPSEDMIVDDNNGVPDHPVPTIPRG